MLEKIGSYDAKTKLPEILRRVEAGEAFTITSRGKPITDLVPSLENATANVPQLWHLEAANVLLSAERNGELETGEVERFISQLEALPITG